MMEFLLFMSENESVHVTWRRHLGASLGISHSHLREGDPTIQRQPIDDPSSRGLLRRLCARR